MSDKIQKQFHFLPSDQSFSEEVTSSFETPSVTSKKMSSSVLSVFSNSSLSLDNMRRLSSKNGTAGYIVRYKSQILLALPDSPEGIAEMLTDDLLSYIDDKLSA